MRRNVDWGMWSDISVFKSVAFIKPHKSGTQQLKSLQDKDKNAERFLMTWDYAKPNLSYTKTFSLL